MSSADIITLDDPRREDILAEIQGRLPKVNRLQNIAQPTIIDGHRFPSIKEAKEYVNLKLRERAGDISHLQLQVTFPLVVNDIPIFPIGYRADFCFLERQHDRVTWKLVVLDAKGMKTEKYLIKRQLVLAIWGITIRET